MLFQPEPWKSGDPDVEIAEEMSAMEALEPPFEPSGPKHESLLRRYWERLVRNYHR
ncbi:MAG: hypothetical protein ACOX4N_09375 [Dethiobacteraceae bacterium]|jgi:hypothetical protein|nr:hypothetical protein [Bacillota bacterium]